MLLEEIARHVTKFDVMHFHMDWIHLPMLSRTNVAFLTTLHGRLDIPGLSTVMRGFPDAPFISISDSQRTPIPDAKWLGTVYHGLPSDSLRPKFDNGTYLAFLGRITPDKGPEVAIRIAQATKMPLRIAAKIPRAETRYFKERLEPIIDGDRIQLIGESMSIRKKAFSPAQPPCCFRSIGRSPSG
jgi:glycosyltransferase involved in cell wall biosynthesis